MIANVIYRPTSSFQTSQMDQCIFKHLKINAFLIKLSHRIYSNSLSYCDF